MTTAALRGPLTARRARVLGPIWRTLKDSREGQIGLVLGAAMLLIIAIGPLVAPYSPSETNVGPAAAGPSASHVFGTDGLGRDVLSRFLAGGTAVLLVPLAATVLSFGIGGAFGLIGAYADGRVDRAIVRTYDIMLIFPSLLVVLVIIAAFGTSVFVIILAVAVGDVPRTGRVIRGAAQSIVAADFVAAARARGESTASILTREVVPNIAGPAIAEFSLRLTYAIIYVSTLSFLGLGAQPPSSNWGLMVAESRGIVSVAPLAVLVPALGIAALSLSFNLIGDAIGRRVSRDRWDTLSI